MSEARWPEIERLTQERNLGQAKCAEVLRLQNEADDKPGLERNLAVRRAIVSDNPGQPLLDRLEKLERVRAAYAVVTPILIKFRLEHDLRLGAPCECALCKVANSFLKSNLPGLTLSPG